MPNFEVGGIDVAVEPQFRRFRPELRRQLREEERLAPSVHIEAEPKFTPAFRRELNRLVREASTGVNMRIEATPVLSRNFRTELNRLVREASVGVNLDIEAKPVLREGFRTELQKQVATASAGIDVEIEARPTLARGFRATLTKLVKEASAGVTVGIELFPTIPTGFRTMVERRLATATAGLSAQIELEPQLSSTFRTQLRTKVTEASRKARIRVPVEPMLARGFQAELRKLIKRSTATIRARIPFRPELERGFRAEADRLIKAEMARYRANVTLRPVLGRDFRRKLKALVESQPATVSIAITTESGREIRRKLIEAVREATENPPITAKVRIEPQLQNLRRAVAREVQGINRTARIVPTARTDVLRRRLTSDVSQVFAGLNKLTHLNITSAFSAVGRVGINAATTALRALRTAARASVIGLGAVAVAIGAVGTAGLKTAADLEFTRTGFGIQLADLEKGEKIFDALTQAAKQSVFQVPDLTKVVNQLIQVDRLSGQLSFEDIIPTLTNITDLGAALDLTPATLNRVAIALTKVAGRGKLTGLELRSLSANVPQLNVIGLIAEDLGVTVPEAFDKISEGAVSSDRAIRVILDGIRKFPGAAGAGLKEVSETFKGALSNLPDILRLGFFDAFQSQLPELTKIIAPGGPLIRAFEKAAPAFAQAFTPLARTLFEGLADFAPALESLVGTVIPLFTSLGRASETVGKQTRKAFDSIGPGLQLLGESLATVAAALSPILPLIGDLVGLVATGLGRALDGLVSGPALDGLLTFFKGLHDLGAKLVPILSQVIELVGEALADALADIDFDQLGDSLGLLVTAGGDLLVALAPLIPELVKIAALFAESLAPALEASIPLIESLLTVLSPIAEVLARMGPGILILVGIAKAAIGLGKAAQAVFNFDQRLKSVRQDLRDINRESGGVTAAGAAGTRTTGGVAAAVGAAGINEAQIRRAFAVVATTAAVTASSVSAYFATASDDITTQVTGIAAAVTGIAAAFAAGGPIGAGIAIVATGIGAIFGQLAKKQAEAREEARKIAALAGSFQAAFKISGVETAEQRVLGLTQEFTDLLDKTKELEGSKGAQDFFGRFNADVAQSAKLLGRSQEAFEKYADNVVKARISDIFAGNASTIRNFADELEPAIDNANRFVTTLTSAAGPAANINIQGVERLGESFQRGGISLDQYRKKLQDFGLTAQQANDTVARLRGDIQKSIEQAAGAKFGFQLSPSVKKAISDQQELARVQELLKTDTDRATDSFNNLFTAIGKATQFLRDYQQAKGGGKATVDQALLSDIDATRQLRDLNKQLADGEITRIEFEAKHAEIIRTTAESNQGVIGQLIVASAGNYDVFKQKANEFKNTVLKGLIEEFKRQGQSTQDATTHAKELIDQIVLIPGQKEFRLISNLPEAKKEAERLKAALEALDKVKLTNINIQLAEQRGHHAGQRAAAEGKLVRRPQFILVGEDGPELILPLTDPGRISQLLAEAQGAGLLPPNLAAGLNTAAAGPVVTPRGAAPAQGLGLGLKPAVDPAAGQEFAATAGKAVANLGDSMTEATKPGLDRWRGGVDTHLTRVTDRFGRFGREARSSLQTTVTDLTTIAGQGTTGVVGALRTGLSTGSSTIRTIVRGYSRSLANALNPVLTAIGQPKINLEQFRKGGVRDPRIVPDGSYQVHVFGERGTKGEAYIPFDPALRPSSRAIADETVRRLGGRAQWFRGGGITGDTIGLDPEFLRRLDRWSNAIGQTYNVGSGYRSIAEQARLYRAYLAGVPGQAKAAPPGSSMHNFGLASDGNHWGGRGPGDFGLVYRVPGEPWHVEPVEARKWAGMADRHIAIVPLPKVPSAGPYGQLSITGKKAMQFGYAQALAWAGKQGTSEAPGQLKFIGGSASEAQAAQWITQAIGLTGVPGTWLSPLLTLTQRESGWNPRAVNLWDSNARAGHPSKGIGQTIESTFLRYALPGMNDIFNPVHNLVAVIRYILAVYDDIKNVQQANASATPRGYEHGAIVNREHMATVAERNRPEVIIPLTNPARAVALADASGVTRMVRRRDSTYSTPTTNVEKVEIQVMPPAAQSPEAYAASMGNRLVPAVAAALDRVLP